MVATSRLSKVLSALLVLILLSITLPPVAPAPVQAVPLPDPAADQVDAAGIDTLPMLAPADQPQNFLTNPDALLTTTQPASLNQPLALARIPSATTASGLTDGQIQITFRIRNTLPAVITPDIPENTSTTDAVEMAANFDYANDPNIIHNILLTNSLTTNAAFVSAEPAPTSQGDSLAWSLGDLPPGASTNVTLTLDVSAIGGDFTVLDGGATAWGTLHGRAVSASAVPVGLAPDNLGSWLMRTVDADTEDEYMLDALAVVGGDPQALFEFVRAMRYESYLGSLRGTRGTLWSEAGNSLDQSNLLIAMLRASGIPARYRHGTLSEARAQEIIAAMFPPPPGVIGQVPPGAAISDPLNDPELLRETQDHWWVEAYLPGQGWQNLDPSFPGATIGDVFVEADSIATDGTDQIAEVPQDVRHTVTMRLRAEMYSQFPSGKPGSMSNNYPLIATFNTVEVVGEPVSLYHMVEENAASGLFSVKTIDYKPLLLVDDQEIVGSNYQDMTTNFPLVTTSITGVWLEFVVRDGEGNEEIYEREIADRVGFEYRQTPGAVEFTSEDGDKPLVNEMSTYTTLFAPSAVSPDAINALYPQITAALQDGQSAYDTVQAMIDSGTEDDPAQLPVLREAVQDINQAARVSQQMHLLSFAATSDFGTQRIGDTYLIRPYYDSPRILIASWEHDAVNERNSMRMDLRKNDLRTVVAPGQSVDGLIAFNYARGLQDSVLESLLLEQMSGQNVQSVSQVFQQARAQQIPFRALASSSLAELETLTISDEAKARIMRTLTDAPFRYLIIVPERPVQIGDTATVGWYQLDMITGETLDMMEDGQRGVIEVSLRFTSSNEEAAAALIGFFQGFALQGMAFLAYLLERLPVSYQGCPPDASAPCENSLKAVWQESIELATDHTNAVISPMVGYAKVAKDCGTYLDLIPKWLATTGDYVEAYGKGIGIKLDLKDPVNKTTGKLESRGAIFFKCTNDIDGLNDASIPTSFRYAGGFLQGASLFNVFAQSLVDPPLPTLLMNVADNAPEQSRAEVALTVSASVPEAAVSGTLTVPNSMLSSASDSASFYAPTLSGMGVGGDGSAYGTASYAATVNTEITSGHIILGPASGNLTVGSQNVSLPNGAAIADYSGTVEIAEAGADQDQITLAGSGAASFLTLNLSAYASSIDPETSATFDAEIVTNHSGTYRVAVEAPARWIVSIDDSGSISADAPTGTAPGDYHLAVVAQDLQAPDLLVSAVHTVTVTAYDGVELTVAPDPLISVPWGSPDSNTADPTNNGQAQLPESAFLIEVTNTSTVERSFDVNVGGMPAEWLILNGVNDTATTITLPPGGTGRIGLYVAPGDTLPAAGTSYGLSISATATDDPTVTASTSQTYTTPAVAYAHLSAVPDIIYTTPGGSGEAVVSLTNIGNIAENFPLTAATPDPTLAISGVSGPVNVAAGATSEQTLTVQTAGGSAGDRSVVTLTTQSGPYEQIATVGVRLVSEQAICPLTTARSIDPMTGAALAAALRDLGDQINILDSAMSDAAQQARVVAAIEAAAGELGSVSGLNDARQDLLDVAQALENASSETEIRSGLDQLCPALVDVPAQWEIATRYNVGARFTPGAVATLTGEPVTSDLIITNEGSEANRYRVTFDAPTGVNIPSSQTVELDPDETTTLPVTVSTPDVDLILVRATIEALDSTGDPVGVSTDAPLAVNVVESFVGILNVFASPDFVETGTSQTDLRVVVANVANATRPVKAHISLRPAEGGDAAWTGEMPLTILPGEPREYHLGTVDTSGFDAGLYVIEVALHDEADDPLKDGAGQGFLTVGQAMTITHNVVPSTVAPGDAQVTTTITTRYRRTGFQSVIDGIGQAVPEVPRDKQHDALARAALAVSTGHSTGALAALVDDTGDTQQPIAQTAAKAGPFYAPALAPLADVPGFTRYEENHASLTHTGDWRLRSYAWGSAGGALRTSTTDDIASLTFNGTWVSVGFVTANSGGIVEVCIDGTMCELVDTYRRERDVTSHVFSGLSAGDHTVTIRHTDQANSFVGGTHYTFLDYIDVWDGSTMLADGTFEENDLNRVYSSSDWSSSTHAVASNSGFLYGGSNVWFPFTGDSVSYTALVDSGFGKVRVFIDGQLIDIFDLRNDGRQQHTFSFDGAGAGAHMLRISAHRGDTTLDTFQTPGLAPFYEPPNYSGIVRYEEDNPHMRYEGAPLPVTTSEWSTRSHNHVSDGFTARSDAPGQVASLEFTGTWVNVGLMTSIRGPIVEVCIDGTTCELVDTYSRINDVTSHVVSGLAPGTHTITVRHTNQANPLVTNNTFLHLDYIDVWDGTPMTGGVFDHEHQRVFRSTDWSIKQPENDNLSDTFIFNGSNAWFHFTGDAFTMIGATHPNPDARAEIFIDGQSQGEVDLSYAFSRSPVPYSFEGLGDGPHVVQVVNRDRTGIIGFDTSDTPFAGIPMVEWYTNEPAGGMLNTAVAGDLNNDGTVEIVTTSEDGLLQVFRGDGSDAGGGTPLIWSYDLGAEPDSPALVDLDSSIPGIEIIVTTPGDGSIAGGMYVFGTENVFGTRPDPLWVNTEVQSTWRAVTIGNLDDDPEPEIVATGTDCPCVLEIVGDQLEVVWRSDLDMPLPPLLADLTGDGTLDILTAHEKTLYLYDYTLSTPDKLAWETEFTTRLDGRGTPSVFDANLDGEPEIALVTDGFIHLVGSDGTVLVSHVTAPGEPGGTTVADIDGDGLVEIVATAKVEGGKVYAIRPVVNGATIDLVRMWDAPALDSTSANAVSTLDLDGDGSWEIIWNGASQGLTIFHGSDGAILFNEPLINSSTRMDYPIVLDVDQDGHAEIVTGDEDGPGALYIIGYDAGWAPSRPLWNQYNYHITNINDDLSIPMPTPDSWSMHNTYRTQTNNKNPMPVYHIELEHDLPPSGITDLENFSHPPDDPAPNLRWQYRQAVLNESVRDTSFNATLPDMQPGEVRKISEETRVNYTLSGGSNTLTLPPLYVAAAHIIALEPPQQTAAPGGTASYTVKLTNPGTTDDTYTLAVAGLPSEWVSLPTTVDVAAGEEIALDLTVTTPADAEVTSYPFTVVATTSTDGSDQVWGTLDLVPTDFEIFIAPDFLEAVPGDVMPYTVILSNTASVNHTFNLTVTGMPDELPPDMETSVEVEGDGRLEVPMLITATKTTGFVPFQVTATRQSDPPLEASAQAAFIIEGTTALELALDPNAATAGPGTAAHFTLDVTNTGDLSDTFDLAVQLPDNGWSYEFLANNVPKDSLTLPPHIFNSASLHLQVTPPVGTPAGRYPLTVVGTSRTVPETQATISGEVVVVPQGVQVEILPDEHTMQPEDQATWNVRVTNTGSTADTFDLAVGGMVGSNSRLSRESVSLAAGATTDLQVTVDTLTHALPGRHTLMVTAQSQQDSEVADVDTSLLNLGGYAEVAVDIEPDTQTLIGTGPLSYAVTISNIGNTDMEYRLTPETAVDGLALTMEMDTITIPARMSTLVLVQVESDGTLPPGRHPFTVTATANGDKATATSTAHVLIPDDQDTTPPDTIITAQPPERSAGTTATFAFTGTDDAADAEDLVFECQLDGGAWQDCTDPQTYSGLTTGSHTFAVRAIDLSGNIDATPATYNWTIDPDVVDDTPPDTIITAQPPKHSADTTATFTFTGTDDGTPVAELTFECQLDGGAWQDCTDPQTYSGLATGSHTFAVRAIDLSGNIDATPATYSWEITTAISSASSSIYLPMIQAAPARVVGEPGQPDLIGRFEISPSRENYEAGEPVTITVEVTNIGTAATDHGFWVDLYIDPAVAPTTDTMPLLWWQACGTVEPCFGIAWDVNERLEPGESVTLTSTMESYDTPQTIWPGSFAAGTSDLYLYVDVWNLDGVPGAVVESNENNNSAVQHNLKVTGPSLTNLSSQQELPTSRPAPRALEE